MQPEFIQTKEIDTEEGSKLIPCIHAHTMHSLANW